jgi:hypothetical protein
VLGVSKQFVYYQFKDKPAILNGVCTTGTELTLSAITDSDELVGSTVYKMRVFCRRLTEIVIDHGKYLAVMPAKSARFVTRTASGPWRFVPKSTIESVS